MRDFRPPVRQTACPPSVGARGFEPPTSWSRTRRANRAALRPDDTTTLQVTWGPGTHERAGCAKMCANTVIRAAPVALVHQARPPGSCCRPPHPVEHGAHARGDGRRLGPGGPEVFHSAAPGWPRCGARCPARCRAVRYALGCTAERVPQADPADAVATAKMSSGWKRSATSNTADDPQSSE